VNSEAAQPMERLRKVLAEIEGLAGTLAQAAERAAGEGQSEAVESLRGTLAAARARIKEAEQTLQRNAAHGAKAADDFVHDNTWISIGIAAAVAFLLGALTAKRD